MQRVTAAVLAVVGVCLATTPAAARSPGEPIRLVWTEGDVAGVTAISNPDGEPIGFVEYRQHRQGDVLSSVRIARFRDGSSDEDSAEARVAGRLEALSGRSIIRDAGGEVVADMTVDVTAGRVVASWGRGSDRKTMDERMELSPATYFGPLIFLVLKNFDANANDGRLVFHTVAPTPRPMGLDMELSRGAAEKLERTGHRLETTRVELRPTVHWALDPVIGLVAPKATFWTVKGEPPALARYSGPRNYGRQSILIQ
jgi:hypothetical protein